MASDDPLATSTELPHEEQAGFKRPDQDPDVSALNREDVEGEVQEHGGTPGRGDSDSDRTGSFVEEVGEHPTPAQIADYVRDQRPQPTDEA